jgi:outer membrane protein OmpA-like peptidoglycan-associated protein
VTSRAIVMLAVATGMLPACSKSPALRGQIAGLKQLTEEAEERGAMVCAPRQLALAHAELRFAELELDQGFSSKAAAHLASAELNARAAHRLSPEGGCTGNLEAAPTPPPVPGDRDGDGVVDEADRCPEQAENYDGFEDDDGCPDQADTDGDGIPDVLDACVLQAEDVDGRADTDGCPDLDDDLDGIPDATDACPTEAEDPDGFADEDGCPEPDNDGDGVPDLTDQCPNTPGQSDQEPLGCPTKPALVVVTDCEVKITQQIHFEYGSDKISPVSHGVLDAVVEVLAKNPAIKLEIQGHTDNRGNPKYNKQLSARRSQAVLKYLVGHGVGPERLTSEGYGLERPLVPNDSDANRALNRRVQFVRTEGAKAGCPATQTQ